MNVLGLCSYPIEAAATRYRLIQFVEPLAKEGIHLQVSPLIGSQSFKALYKNKSLIKRVFELGKPLASRLLESFTTRKYDILLVQREAMFFGPAFFEHLFRRIGNLPMILDLDDATYIRYVSPTYGKVGSFFKFFGKTDNLIKYADVVICGNRFIAEYVEMKGKQAVVIPTVVDTNIFRPIEKDNRIPIIGWVGTHSTFPFLQSIFPILQKIALKYDFILKIIGSGKDEIKIDGVKVETLPWSMKREVSDFQSFDIGLYPMEFGNKTPDEWIAGKSGFKAIQYMSVGIPFVVTPIGVCAEIGIEGETHFSAETTEEWYTSLDNLLSNDELRKKMGIAGRSFALQNFSLQKQAEKLAQTLVEVLNNRKKVG